MTFFKIICLTLFSAVLISLIIRIFNAGCICTSTRRLDKNVCIITGGNSGIGRETALDLYKRGCKVYITCRSEFKCSGAVSYIQDHRSKTTGSVIPKNLDLSSLKSVKDFSDDFLSRENRLDILINNAGIVTLLQYTNLTEDGFEETFQVNYLSHFLLTHKLMPLLINSTPSRVVNVASLIYPIGYIDFNNINSLDRSGHMKYAQSKLATVLFTQHFSELFKESGVTAYSLHPGTIITNCTNSLPYFLNSIARHVDFVFKNSTAGAQTSIHCAVTEDVEKFSGCFFDDCVPIDFQGEARNSSLAKRLWKFSEQLLDIQFYTT